MKDINATVIIDLEGKNEEVIWRNIKYTRRKYVKQAFKSNLHYKRAERTEENLNRLYKIYSEVMNNAKAAVKPYHKLMEVIAPAKDNLFFIKKDKKIVGFFAFKEITDKFFDLNSNRKGIRAVLFANSKKYNDYRPNDYMYWTTIKYALDGKYDFVDLAGWQMKARGHLKNVNKFKEEWGGKVFYYTKNYSILTALRRKLIRNINLFWKINLFFKKIIRNLQGRKDANARS
jgi:lipid II:glycine glycyltransferase (peptidoglycan interpeptide bridge formation enzyme)